jgi:hypothetical protein
MNSVPTDHSPRRAEDLGEAFVREAGDSGFQVAIDCVWGRPAEAFLAAINTQGIFCHGASFKLGKALGRLSRLQLPCCVAQD